jgi:hypothetical protein
VGHPHGAHDAPARPRGELGGRPTRGEQGDRLLVFSGAPEEGLLDPRAHRAIDVVYDPAAERHANYVPTVLPRRYDAFVYLDETEALYPYGETSEQTSETRKEGGW